MSPPYPIFKALVSRSGSPPFPLADRRPPLWQSPRIFTNPSLLLYLLPSRRGEKPSETMNAAFDNDERTIVSTRFRYRPPLLPPPSSQTPPPQPPQNSLLRNRRVGLHPTILALHHKNPSSLLSASYFSPVHIHPPSS